MGWTTSFYSLDFTLLSLVIGSGNSEWEKKIKTKAKETEILKLLIKGNYKALQQLSEDDPLNYHTSFFSVYSKIVAVLGKELDPDAGSEGDIGFRGYEEVDELLQEKGYPPQFSLETLFQLREVPGYKGKLPLKQEYAEDGYWVYSYISPVTIEKARTIAKSLKTPRNKNKKQKTSKANRDMDFPSGAEQRIRDWLLNPKYMYPIPKWTETYHTEEPVGIFKWNELPEVLQKHIILQIDCVKTLCKFALASKTLHQLIMQDDNSDETYWKPFRETVGIVAFTF